MFFWIFFVIIETVSQGRKNMKVDIVQDFLKIESILNVIKNQIPPKQKMMKNGRKSDGFILILTGSCDYKTSDGDCFTASAGDLLYLSHEAVYSMQTGEEVYSFIFCDFMFLEKNARKCAVYKVEKSSGLENLFVKLFERFLIKSNGAKAECFSLLYKIYEIALESKKEYIGNGIREKMQFAKRCMEEDFSVSVQELSKKLGITEVYFRKLFKAAFQISPLQYINFVRIEHAKGLMEYPFFSLEECALKSGFSSLQYFSRAFKKTTGFTPAVYRKMMQNAQDFFKDTR